MRNFFRFLKNVWVFRKQLYNFRWWDYHFTLRMMEKCLEVMSDNLETKGIEVDGPRMKKVEKMRRAMEIIRNTSGVEHIMMAEKELGSLHLKPFEFKDSETHPGSYELVDNDTPEEKEHNKKVHKEAREIEEKEWEELWRIFKGQDYDDYIRQGSVDWDNWFDGTGMRGWWD